ncbi:YegP family protein [Glaesserella sp.]|uniref:YegP family protein n=1 Tax=Glaesserella sp. TaxID=2094731 RepID=UPI0035A14A31
MALGWYELKLAKDGQFMFNLKAANSQVILTSELYKTRSAAEKGIASVQKNGVEEKNFEFKTTKSDQPYFILKSANHQEIGRSEYYSSKAAAQNGVKSVMNNAASTVIKDKTTE